MCHESRGGGTCSRCCAEHTQNAQGEAHSRDKKRDGGQNVFLLVSSSSSTLLQCTQSIDKIQHKGKWPTKSNNA